MPKLKQGNTESFTSRNQDIKCFKCQGYIANGYPNKRVMVINAQGEIELEDKEADEVDNMPPLEDAYDG